MNANEKAAAAARNKEAASRANDVVLIHYRSCTAVLAYEPDVFGYHYLCDLLADLRHWATAHGVDFDEAARAAEASVKDEVFEATA